MRWCNTSGRDVCERSVVLFSQTVCAVVEVAKRGLRMCVIGKTGRNRLSRRRRRYELKKAGRELSLSVPRIHVLKQVETSPNESGRKIKIGRLRYRATVLVTSTNCWSLHHSSLPTMMRRRSLARPWQHQLRVYSQGSAKSRHAQWYADIVPGMIPIALIGSTVYMVRELVIFPERNRLKALQALQLVRTNLSHEQYLEEARARVSELEARLDQLQNENVLSRDGEDVSASNPKKWWIF